MGNSCVLDFNQTNSNFETLIESIITKDGNNTKTIIENSTTDFSGMYNGLTFYHYLVIHSPYYAKTELQELCDIVYKNKKRFGDVRRVSIGKKYLVITTDDKGKYWMHYVENNK